MKEMTKTKTQTTTKTLTTLEEKVLRMRHGLRAPDNLALDMADPSNPEIAAIEQRVQEAVAVRNNPTKRKILNALRRK